MDGRYEFTGESCRLGVQGGHFMLTVEPESGGRLHVYSEDSGAEVTLSLSRPELILMTQWLAQRGAA